MEEINDKTQHWQGKIIMDRVPKSLSNTEYQKFCIYYDLIKEGHWFNVADFYLLFFPKSH